MSTSFYQIVLYVSQMFWTTEVHDAIRDGGNQGLKDYYKQLVDQVCVCALSPSNSFQSIQNDVGIPFKAW